MKASKTDLARRKLLSQSTNNNYKVNTASITTTKEAVNSSNDVLEKAKTIIDAIKQQNTQNLLQNFQNNNDNLNISTDSIESNNNNGLNIRPAKVTEITYAPDTAINPHAALIDVLKNNNNRRSKSPNTTDSTDGGLSFSTNGVLESNNNNNGSSEFMMKAIQELVAKVQHLYDELIQEKESNSKYRTEMERKFEEMSKRLEKLESKENKNDDNMKDLKIGNPVSALQSVQTTSTPIKTEENNSITDDLKVEI